MASPPGCLGDLLRRQTEAGGERVALRLGLLGPLDELRRRLGGGGLLHRLVALAGDLLDLRLLRHRLVLAALPLLDLPGAHVGPGLGLAFHGREVRRLDLAIGVPVGDVFRLPFGQLAYLGLKLAHACFGLLLFVRQCGHAGLGRIGPCPLFAHTAFGLVHADLRTVGPVLLLRPQLAAERQAPFRVAGAAVEPVEIRRQIAAPGLGQGEPLALPRPDPGRLLAAPARRLDLLLARPLGLGDLGGLAGGGVLRLRRRVLLFPARALGGRGHDLEIHTGGRPPFRRILLAADILEAAGMERGHGMAMLVDEPRRPRPLGLHLVPVPPQGRRAVHRAISGHGTSRGQHVEVRLRPVLVMAVRDAGGLADAPGVRQHGLLVTRGGLDVALVLVLVARVLALAQNVLCGLPRGRRATAFDGAESRVECPHDPGLPVLPGASTGSPRCPRTPCFSCRQTALKVSGRRGASSR